MSIFTDLADKLKKKDNSSKTRLGQILDTATNLVPSRKLRNGIEAVRNPRAFRDEKIKKGKKIAKGAWGFIQGTLSSVAGMGITAGQEIATIGKTKEQKKRIRQTSVTPKTKFEKTIFGDKPIGNVARQTFEFRQSVDPKAKERPLLDYPIGLALGVLDFASGGSSKKVATSAIPEIVSGLKKSEEIIPFIKRMIKGSDDEIATVAKNLENISDPRLVEEELLRLSADKSSPIKLTKEATSTIKRMREMDAIAEKIGVDEVNGVMNLKTVDGLTPRQIKDANAFLLQNGDVLLKQFKDIKDKTGGVLEDSEVVGKTLRLIENDSELFGTLSKNQQADFSAQINALKLKADNEIVKLFEEGSENFDKDIVEAFSSQRTNLGRAFRILSGKANDADPSAYQSIVQRLQDAGKTLEDIEQAVDDFKKARGTDAFKDPAMREIFFRQLVKPRIMDVLNEYRYINMLSSPKTHLFNIASNAGQALLNVPIRLVTGAIDKIGSALTGRAREQYMREVPNYAKAAISSVPEAFMDAIDVLRKGGLSSRRPDMRQMETGKTGPMIYILRAMDAGDVFFRKIIQRGEESALIKRAELSGTPLSQAQINQIKKEAASTAERLVYRSKLDPNNETGQGKFNSAIDAVASSLFMLGEKVPLVRWFVPFLQTPTQVLKQGIEMTPVLGLVNMAGNTKKADLFAKQLIGSTITASLASKAFNDEITWDVPANKSERDAFYADGRKPYSIKVGGKWIPYNRLGPAGFPIALMANIAHKSKYSDTATTDAQTTKMFKVAGGMLEFFADQSYVQGVGDIVQVLQEGGGGEGALGSTLENLSRQLIPLSALQGWVARLTDEYIWAERKTFPGNYVDSVMAQLPGYARKLFGVELRPREGVDGDPIKRSVDSSIESYKKYQESRGITQFNKEKTTGKNTLQEAVDNHVYNVDNLASREEKIQYLKDLQSSNPVEYKAVFEEIKSKQPDKDGVILNSTEKRIRSLGVADGGRAEYIKNQLDKLETKEEKIAYIKNLQDKKILTKEVFNQLKYLLNQ